MAHKDLTEHFVAGEEVYAGKLLRVQRDVVRLRKDGTVILVRITRSVLRDGEGGEGQGGEAHGVPPRGGCRGV